MHVLFVHGMRAERAGSAQPFMRGLCLYGPVQCPPGRGDLKPVSRTFFDVGPMPEPTVMGQTIWRSPKEWEASRPFVDRYVFARTGAPPVVVDEVNWWPLLLPLKCRVMVAPEAALSGADKAHLELCNRKNAPYHPWLSDAELAAALKGPTVSGGGAWANRTLKQQIVNWGVSDAVIALGPMRGKFRLAIEKAFEFASEFDGRGAEGQEFVVVSESLGSFVVMDAGTNPLDPLPNAKAVLGGSSSLYFFANQFALLELGRISNLRGAQAGELSPTEMLLAWARRPGRTAGRSIASEAPPRAKQIIALNDPATS